MDVAALEQVHLQPELLPPVLVLADHLGLVERPLVGGLLLGEEHLLHGVVAAEGGDGEEHREDGGDERDAPGEMVLPALVELFGVGELDLRHGSGSDAAVTAIDLLFHGGAPGLERRGEPLRLLLEVFASLVEDVAGSRLRIARRVLRLLEPVAPALGQSSRVSRPLFGAINRAAAAPATAPRKNQPR